MSEQERFPLDSLKKPSADGYGADPLESEVSSLMAAAKAGDREAFGRIVQKLRGRSFFVAQSLVGSREDAMELCQEAFFKTYRARETFRDGEPFLPWFHRILRNTCYTFLRKHRRLKKVSLSAGKTGAGSEESSGHWEIEDESEPPSGRMEADERSQAFWRGFETLSARDREILALRHFEELSYQATADSLEIPVGTVMSRLFHARRRLREALSGHLDELSMEGLAPGDPPPASSPPSSPPSSLGPVEETP